MLSSSRCSTIPCQMANLLAYIALGCTLTLMMVTTLGVQWPSLSILLPLIPVLYSARSIVVKLALVA